MKFNIVILLLLFQLDYIKPFYIKNEKKPESIDFKINFDKIVQVSFKNDKKNSNNNFFLQLREKKEKNLDDNINNSKGN
jgi:hypothetical protein